MESLLNAPAIVLALVGILGLIGLATALVKAFLAKRNGNGSPKVIVQLPDTVLRGIIAETAEFQRVDSERRHLEMMILLREIRDANKEGFEIIRDRLHDLASPLMIAIEAVRAREKR